MLYNRRISHYVFFIFFILFIFIIDDYLVAQKTKSTFNLFSRLTAKYKNLYKRYSRYRKYQCTSYEEQELFSLVKTITIATGLSAIVLYASIKKLYTFYYKPLDIITCHQTPQEQLPAIATNTDTSSPQDPPPDIQPVEKEALDEQNKETVSQPEKEISTEVAELSLLSTSFIVIPVPECNEPKEQSSDTIAAVEIPPSLQDSDGSGNIQQELDKFTQNAKQKITHLAMKSKQEFVELKTSVHNKWLQLRNKYLPNT